MEIRINQWYKFKQNLLLCRGAQSIRKWIQGLKWAIHNLRQINSKSTLRYPIWHVKVRSCGLTTYFKQHLIIVIDSLLETTHVCYHGSRKRFITIVESQLHIGTVESFSERPMFKSLHQMKMKIWLYKQPVRRNETGTIISLWYKLRVFWSLTSIM